MYTSKNFQIRDEETFSLCIPTDRDYKILQLTDLHLGFGMFSGKKDRLALAAVTELIRRTGPDLIVLTGDSVFPFFPKSGTMNNRKQAEKLLAFLDGFQIPYTLVFGNHDCEMGSTCNKEQLAEIRHTDISFVDGYALRPGETITASTLEKLVIPQDCNGKILGKNSLLMMGIEVFVAYINPGYSGHMPLLIKNVGPITVTLSAGLKICQLELNGLTVPATRAYPERYNMEVLKDHAGIEGMSLPSSDEPNPLSDFLKRRIAELASSH